MPFQFPVASPTSSQNDFDFLVGSWEVRNRKLRDRLVGCQEWDEFSSRLQLRKALLGKANVERYTAEFDGKPFEGMAVRLFDPQSRLWTIYWLDSNSPKMDPHPVVGSFDAGVGKFYARDNLRGQDIVVIYQWDARNPEAPIWSQAFSADDGANFEWNWIMTLSRDLSVVGSE